MKKVKSKVVWLIVSCLMVLSLVLASCGTTEPEEEEEEEEVVIPKEEEEVEEEEEIVEEEGPEYGGRIGVCSSVLVSSPNPAQASLGPGNLNLYTYEKLGKGDWTRGPAGTNEDPLVWNYCPYIVPALAESWEQPNPYTVVFHIRQGVHWHNKSPVNGRELTADDVAYSMNDLCFGHPECAYEARPYVVSITATDKYTVEVKVNAIHCSMLEYLTEGTKVWIWPPEMDEVYGAGWATADAVCGTGPFVMTDFISNSSATFERNPDYWGYDELNPGNKLPYVDGVKFLMIGDESTYLAAFRTGKIDLIQNLGKDDADPLLERNPQLKSKASMRVDALKTNMRMDKEPFNDIRIRKALNMAIDREAIVSGYLEGCGEILNFPMLAIWKDVYTPIDELPESTRENYEYNPEKAKQLLADAGYPDGLKTETIVNSLFTEELQIFVAYWRAIGVDCEINVVDPGAWATMTYGKTYPYMSFGSGAPPDPVTVLVWKKTTEYFNYEMCADPEFDAGVDEMTATSDATERDRMAKELSVQYLDMVPHVEFPANCLYTIWWPWLKNYHGEGGLGRHNLPGILARTWVDQELKKEMGY